MLLVHSCLKSLAHSVVSKLKRATVSVVNDGYFFEGEQLV
jgi:hypothetical protein